jgi:transcriptional regulator with XRE-family HTH domain
VSKYLKQLAKSLDKRMAGRSQTWLAGVSGITQSKISRILAGQNEPDLSDLFALAKAFNIQPSELLSDAKTETSLTQSDLVALVEPILALGKVTPFQVQAVKAFLTGNSDFLDELPESQSRRLRESLKAL